MKSKLYQNLFLAVLLLTPTVSFAQFLPLVGIPGISDNNIDFNTYINALYALSISIAGLLAVIKIIIAGVKYMLSDVVTSKAEAKSDIQGALIGLLIVVSAVVILNQINPRLTESNIFLSSVTRPAPQPVNNPGSPNTNGPLPPPSANANASRDIACNRQPDGSWDCSQAIATCTGSNNGRVIPEGRVSNPGDITCSYGTTLNISCQQTTITPPDGINPGVYAYDCTSASAQCSSRGGTPTVTGANSETVRCYIPN